MVVPAMSISGICYNKTLVENEMINAAHYPKFLKRIKNRWHGNQKHAIWLLTKNARSRPHALVIC